MPSTWNQAAARFTRTSRSKDGTGSREVSRCSDAAANRRARPGGLFGFLGALDHAVEALHAEHHVRHARMSESITSRFHVANSSIPGFQVLSRTWSNYTPTHSHESGASAPPSVRRGKYRSSESSGQKFHVHFQFVSQVCFQSVFWTFQHTTFHVWVKSFESAVGRVFGVLRRVRSWAVAWCSERFESFVGL